MWYLTEGGWMLVLPILGYVFRPIRQNPTFSVDVRSADKNLKSLFLSPKTAR